MAKKSAKVGRPKLADTEMKKESIVTVITVLLVAATLAIVGYIYLAK